jgi:cbb3-type cytochrome oxidase maturation protein
MEALYLLIPLSVAAVFAALWVFFHASDDGQFDDLVGPALRVLQDDDRSATPHGDTGSDPLGSDPERKPRGSPPSGKF